MHMPNIIRAAGSADARLFMPGKGFHEHGFFNEDGRFDAANAKLCRMVGEVLTRHYPGHPWGVVSEIEHGIVKVALQGFVQWPYVVHVATLKGDPGMRSIVKAGGEILERLKMPRKGFNLADWKSATTLRPWHFHRNSKAPV